MIDYIERTYTDLESKALEQAATADDLSLDLHDNLREDFPGI